MKTRRPTDRSVYPAARAAAVARAGEPGPRAGQAIGPVGAYDPGELMRTCANCGSTMEKRKRKLICHGCGYFPVVLGLLLAQ